MEKFKYSPGMPGYGSKGTDGSVGLTGLSFFGTDFIANSVEGTTKLTERIQNNQNLYDSDPAVPMDGYDEGRRYQTGDLFIDFSGTLYKINLDLSTPWEDAGIVIGGGESIFSNQQQVEIASGIYYNRYANTKIGETDKKLVDTYISNAPADYLTDKAVSNYDIPLANHGQVYCNDLNALRNDGLTDSFINAFNIWSAGGLGEDEKSVSLVRSITSNNWRFGCVDNAFAIRTSPVFSLDFTRVGINNLSTPLYALDVVGDIKATGTYIGNLAGGHVGAIPYQSATGITAFTASSVTPGAVMTLVGGTIPTWAAPATGGTVKEVGTDGTALTGGPITLTGVITHSTASGFKHVPAGGSSGQILRWLTTGEAQWGANATVTSVATDGTALTSGGPITTTGTITHSTASGFKHIPPGGSAGQVLEYDGAGGLGTAKWLSPPWSTTTGTVTSISGSGAIICTPNPIIGSGTISHSFATGSIHIPAGGSTGKILQWYSDGVADWAFTATTDGITNTTGTLGLGHITPTGATIDGNVTITNLGYLDVSGSITSNGNIIAYFTSDGRLKTNIIPISDSLNKLSKINGVEFDWNEEEIKKIGRIEGYFVKKHDVGVIAQELQEVLPEVVIQKIDGYLGVQYEKIVPLLIEAIKELSNKVNELEKKVNNYGNR